jgi:hypothetical protein
VQQRSELATVQMTPLAFVGVVVDAVLAAAFRARESRSLRVRKEDVNAHVMNRHLHPPHRPRARHAQQLPVQLGAVHFLASVANDGL